MVNSNKFVLHFTTLCVFLVACGGITPDMPTNTAVPSEAPMITATPLEMLTVSPIPSSLPYDRLSSLFDHVSISNPPGTCLPKYPTLVLIKGYSALDYIGYETWLDEKGIAIIDYGGSYDNAGWQYSPYWISAVGMYGFDDYCTRGDPLGLKIAVTQGDWLVENAIRFGDKFAIWVYPFPNPPLGLPKYWTSGLGNGFGAAFLLQLYSLTGDPTYLEVSKLGIQSLLVNTEDYGIRSVLDDGRTIFYEEAAHPDVRSDAHILNGHFYALQGLEYVAEYTHDPTLSEEASKRIDEIADYIGDFDASVTNLYALNPQLTRPRDNYGSVALIQALIWAYGKLPNPVLLKYALKWQQEQLDAPEADLYISSSGDNVFPGTLLVQNPDFTLHANTPWDIRDKVGPKTDTFVLDMKQVLPVRSFGYASNWGRYPTDYTLSVSTNGVTWDEITHVRDFKQSHALILMEDVPARYVRLFIEKASTDQGVQLGPLRADTASYWTRPIVLLVNNGFAEAWSSDNLSDDDPATTATVLSGNAIIYGDLQKLSTPGCFVLSGNTAVEPVKVQLVLETSSDLEIWKAVLGEETAWTTVIPGRIELPTGIAPWRYFRLTIKSESDIQLTAFDVLEGQ